MAKSDLDRQLLSRVYEQISTATATATTANADRRPSAIRKISPFQPRYIRNTSFSGRVRWLIGAEESTFAELESEAKRNLFERARE